MGIAIYGSPNGIPVLMDYVAQEWVVTWMVDGFSEEDVARADALYRKMHRRESVWAGAIKAVIVDIETGPATDKGFSVTMHLQEYPEVSNEVMLRLEEGRKLRGLRVDRPWSQKEEFRVALVVQNILAEAITVGEGKRRLRELLPGRSEEAIRAKMGRIQGVKE